MLPGPVIEINISHQWLSVLSFAYMSCRVIFELHSLLLATTQSGSSHSQDLRGESQPSPLDVEGLVSNSALLQFQW